MSLQKVHNFSDSTRTILLLSDCCRSQLETYCDSDFPPQVDISYHSGPI